MIRTRTVLLAFAFFIVISAWLGPVLYRKIYNPAVILIIIDTLPAGHVGCYGYKDKTTPNIDVFAEKSITFRQAIAASPWTLPSIASIFTGQFPSRHQAGLRINPRTEQSLLLGIMRKNSPTMARMFKEHGYKTVGFFNNPFVDPKMGLDQGFDHYDYNPGDALYIRRANVVVDHAIEWIKNNGKEPFFMVLHFFDPHLAYDPLPGLKNRFVHPYQGNLQAPFRPENLADFRAQLDELTVEDKRFIRELFDAEVATVDAEVGRFMEWLESEGMLDNSLIVLTSDHGEEFWEHNGFEHGHSMFREVLEVPLIIKLPGVTGVTTKGRVIQEPVSMMDILPTVADIMGWESPQNVDGMSLYFGWGIFKFPEHKILSENLMYGDSDMISISVSNYKIIINQETRQFLVFDLQNDPHEKYNISGKKDLPQPVSDIKRQLLDYVDEKKRIPTAKPATMDDEMTKKLKSLGYLPN